MAAKSPLQEITTKLKAYILHFKSRPGEMVTSEEMVTFMGTLVEAFSLLEKPGRGEAGGVVSGVRKRSWETH